MQLARVLADDLTGACDVAGELIGLGRAVRVRSATGERVPSSDGGVCWVENTQSRAVPVAEAVRRVAVACGERPLGRGELAFKKIDTALRGHVAAELAAAIEALAPRLVLVAPAIPEVGRTTEGGRQLIAGVPVSETAFGRDPVNPVRESSVLVTLQTLDRVHAVPLETVRDGPRYAASVAGWLEAPCAVVVADAREETDLAASVAVLAAVGEPALVVGSIGVARALAPALERVTARAREHEANDAAADGDGVLVACGSLHPAARAQLRAVEERWGVAPAEVGADTATTGEMVAMLVAGSGVGVLTLGTTFGTADPAALGAALGRAAREAVARRRPRGLVLIGGETAYHCLQALGDPALEVAARPTPLVVAARIAEGPWRGMTVCCKGGSAGDAEAVNDMIALVAGQGAGS